jgi:predicted SAM-dependent methyltransferase
MVVEHLHDPVAGLSKLARWTRPNGWLAISVPNAGSVDFTLFKNAGYALQLPTHLYHFTPRTLTRLLSQSGWVVQKVFHQRGISNLVGSLGYKCDDWGLPQAIGTAFKTFPKRGGLFSQVFLFPLAYLLAVFGQTGRMTVWATKADD